MTSFTQERFRGGLAVVLALLVSALGVRSASAGDTAPVPSAGDSAKSPAASTDTAPGDNAATEAPAPAAPRLQIQDEGPMPTEQAFAPRARTRAAPDDLDERPFWKSWIFWTVTGALVVGTASLIAYTSSKTNSALAPCPPEVLVSLGCYGAGR